MFENLKTKNTNNSKYIDLPPIGSNQARGFSVSPGATSYSIKTNEKSRLVRCNICGFPCDIERDAQAKYGSWAGFGINQGSAQTAGHSIGDARVPAAGSVSQKADTYYNRDITAGCPACGSLVYAE